MDIGFIRENINLLYENAHLFAAQKKLENAVELLELVRFHPVSDQSRLLEGRIRDSADNLLSGIRDELPPDIFEAAVKRSKSPEIDQVISSLLESRR